MSYQTTMDNIEREGLANSQAIADGTLTGLASLDMEDGLELRRKRAAARRGMRAQQSKEEQVGEDCGQERHHQPCWCGGDGNG